MGEERGVRHFNICNTNTDLSHLRLVRKGGLRRFLRRAHPRVYNKLKGCLCGLVVSHKKQLNVQTSLFACYQSFWGSLWYLIMSSIGLNLVIYLLK